MRIKTSLVVLALVGLVASDAFAFYNPQIGRWVNRDPIGERGGLNLYAFAENRPCQHIDVLGLWGTSLHHQIVDDWLDDPIFANFPRVAFCVINVRALIKDGSDEVDGVGAHAGEFLQAQSANNAHQHAMARVGESTFSAENRYNTFVDSNVAEARRLADRARRGCSSSEMCNILRQAVRLVGKAFHAVSDNQSPAHAGFQVWDGSLDPEEAIAHAAAENMAVYVPMSATVLEAIDGELMSDLLYVLAIDAR